VVEEEVTLTAGVPTIWQGLLAWLDGVELPKLRRIPCGGSAVPRALSDAFREKLGKPILQAWGMTETSPVATAAHVPARYDELPEEEKAKLWARQGARRTLTVRDCQLAAGARRAASSSA
jgi:fatty-acyl-CoA synthase